MTRSAAWYASVRKPKTEKWYAAIRAANTSHGYTTGGKKRPEYMVWRAMMGRCYNPAVRSYPDYGGRGIVVCERWHKFENFLADMGNRPAPRLTIDRIDSSGPYSPQNCRWATYLVQGRNRRNVHVYEVDGQQMTLGEAAERYGIPRGTVVTRLGLGWSLHDALIKPSRKYVSH